MQQIQRTISAFMSRKPAPSVGPEATVMDAINSMASENSDCVLVLEADAVVGIFTERDFLNRVAAERRVAAETPVREVMTPEPETLPPDAYVSYAIERMVNRAFRNIPILQEGEAPSVLTVRDVMQHLSAVLAEVEREDAGEEEFQDWEDIGGGG